MDITEKAVYQGITISSILKDISIVGTRQMTCRRSHGFIIKLKGATEYCFGNRTWILSAGEVLFVEKGSSYFIKEVDPGYSYVVNFDAPESFSQKMDRLPMPSNADIVPFAEKMYHYWQRENIYGTLSCLYSILEKSTERPDLYLSLRDRQLLEPVETHISDYLTDPDLSMKYLSELSGVSNAYLRRIFKRRYGISPAGYVTRERIRLACQLLISGEERSIAGISSAVGYRDPLYFSRIFKKQMGLSPSDYRASHLNDLF